MTASKGVNHPNAQIADLANLVGRLAFLLQNELGEKHSVEIQREADAIRDSLDEADEANRD